MLQVSNPFADLIPGGQPEQPVAPPGTRLVPRPPPGYRIGADGRTLEPIPGGPADRSAQREPPAGYRQTPEGNFEAVPGGPADPLTRPQDAPSGYRYTAEGTLEAITGGPADPNRLPAQDMQAAMLQIRNTVRNAREAQRMSREGWFATGFGAGVARRVAPSGSTPANLQALLSQIGSNTAFDRLERMRRESPTGAAVGNVTERELELLKNSVASLDVTQSDEQFQRSMDDVIQNYARVYERLGGNPDELTGEPSATSEPRRVLREGEEMVLARDVPPNPNPLSPQQQTAYDAFMDANPRATAEQVRSFFRGMGLEGNVNAEEIVRARDAGGGVRPGSEAELAPPDISDMRGGGGIGESVDTVGRGAANSVLAGIPDRAAALANTAFGEGSYDENLRREMAITAADWRDRPAESIIGTIAGALMLPTGVRGASLSSAARTMRAGGTRGEALIAARHAAARRLAIEGSAYGAVHGFTTTEGDIGTRAWNAFTSAAVGAGTGAVLPYAEAGGRAVGRGMSSVLTTAPRLAERVVFRAIRADGNTPQSLGRQAATAEADAVPYMLADSGENARGLLSASARAPGAGRTTAINALDERQAGLVDRVTGAIERDLGPVSNPHEIADTLMTAAREEAAPLYEAAYARPGADAFVTRIQPLLDRPSIRRAYANAHRIAAEEGRDPSTLGFELDQAGEVVLRRVPSWQTLDYIKRGLDDVVESYRDPTSGRLNLDTEGRAINNTLRQFLRSFDEANPDYASARGAYGGPVSGLEAMRRGQRALNMTGDDLEAVMRDMSPFQRSLFRLGTRRAMAEAIASRGDTANVVHALVGTGKRRAMLSRLFGDRRQFEVFVRTLEEEENAFQTYRRARQGSPTAANVADDSDVAVALGVGDLFTSGAPIISTLRVATRARRRQVTEAAQQSIAAMLGESDPEKVRNLIQRFRQEETRRLIGSRRGRAGAATSRTAATVSPDVPED